MPSPSLTLLRTQTDDRLVELARGGHERAFEAIVERYRKPLLRGARRVLPEGRAEDALQQALLAAWTALQRGDEVRELRPWLYRIVYNTALNALRVSGYDYAELHEAVRIADDGDDALERRAVMRQTLASLAALPERQREALIRTAVSGDSPEEIARDLGLSGNALRQLVHRARVSMRAAATALTPMPLVTAAASGSSRSSLVERLSELVAGGGASATLAKAGAAAVLAGGAISGPAIVDHVADRPSPDRAVAAAAAGPPRHAKHAAAAAQPEPVRAVPVAAHHEPAPARRKARPNVDRRARSEKREDGDEDRSRSSGSGSSGSDDDHSGSGRRESQRDDSGSSGSGHDGSGGDDTVSSGSGSSGSGSSGSGHGGSGGEESVSSGSSGSGSSEALESSGSGSSGSSSGDSGGSGKDDGAEPTLTPEPGED